MSTSLQPVKDSLPEFTGLLIFKTQKSGRGRQILAAGTMARRLKKSEREAYVNSEKRKILMFGGNSRSALPQRKSCVLRLGKRRYGNPRYLRYYSAPDSRTDAPSSPVYGWADRRMDHTILPLSSAPMPLWSGRRKIPPLHQRNSCKWPVPQWLCSALSMFPTE